MRVCVVVEIVPVPCPSCWAGILHCLNPHPGKCHSLILFSILLEILFFSISIVLAFTLLLLSHVTLPEWQSLPEDEMTRLRQANWTKALLIFIFFLSNLISDFHENGQKEHAQTQSLRRPFGKNRTKGFVKSP